MKGYKLMKKRKFKILALTLTMVLALSMVGCSNIFYYLGSPTSPLVPNYGISYETRSDICKKITFGYGFADYGEEIPLSIRFTYQPNVRINILESEYYEIVGPSEFNTNDYQLNSDGYFDVDFSIKITKKTYPNCGTVNFRITCLCGEENCGRFESVSPGNHYYDDTRNFGFLSDSKGIIFAPNHSHTDGTNFQPLKDISKYRGH